MPYQVEATMDTPMHIIYLIDASGSMDDPMPQSQKEQSQKDPKKRKIDKVSDLLEEIAKIMLKRSKKGATISNRYKIALYAYGNVVTADTNNQFITIDKYVEQIPDFGDLMQAQTNTKGAFEYAYQLLTNTLPSMNRCPAPLVCHLTDGEYTKSFGDPTPVVRQIMNLHNPDGNVLVQNIYISEKSLFTTPILDAKQWEGIQSPNELQSEYAKALLGMSSPLPETYAKELQREGYRFRAGSPMLFPSSSVEMLRLAFMTSGSTPRGVKELPSG